MVVIIGDKNKRKMCLTGFIKCEVRGHNHFCLKELQECYHVLNYRKD